jgi:hypothetical protein
MAVIYLTVCDGEIQRAPVRAGLTSRIDFKLSH